MMHLDWDPEIDTPATVAVLGGGPAGVEAALYARFLGYYVLLIDARRIGSRLIRWGDHPLPADFATAASPLGLAALEAQEKLEQCPAPDATPTCKDFVEQYLLPLAKSDLIEECVHINCPVLSIGRAHWPKGKPVSIEQRAEDEFRILMKSPVRGEFSQLADIILDCTGEGRIAAGVGPGSSQAIGQQSNIEHCLLGIRDFVDRDRDKFVSKRTIQFGCSVAACQNAVQFAKQFRDRDDCLLTWIVPKGRTHSDWLAEVAATAPELAIDASQILDGQSTCVVHLESWGAESMLRNEKGIWNLKLLVGDEETVDTQCEQVLLTDLHQPWSFTDGLNIQRCPKRDLPLAASHWLDQIGDGPMDCGPESFITTEPHYYVLGKKSVGGDRRYGFTHLRQQIQQVFGLIGGRRDLDLYRTVRPQSQFP